MKYHIAKTQSWCLLALCLSITACGTPDAQLPALGIHFAAQVKRSDLQAIRSFRILAFEQHSVYRCDAAANTVYYGTSGFTASATFDWSLGSGVAPPTTRLFLPKDATSKRWIIQVEAFTVSRIAQNGEKPVATGCVANIQMFDERPLPAEVELHSTKK